MRIGVTSGSVSLHSENKPSSTDRCSQFQMDILPVKQPRKAVTCDVDDGGAKQNKTANPRNVSTDAKRVGDMLF